MKLSLILQECRGEERVHAYLRVQIVDLSDGGIDITSVNSPSYFYAGLDGLLFERQLYVCFLGELLSSSRVAFADQVVHDDKVDVPVEDVSGRRTS
jgi:hypothetical protein